MLLIVDDCLSHFVLRQRGHRSSRTAVIDNPEKRRQERPSTTDN
jgi:hypothetical protein